MVPLAKLLLFAIWPTAATGLAVMVDEPLPSTAAVPLALVIIPQPRLTVALPEKSIPVSALLSSAFAQYLPLCTTAAVAVALMVGGDDRKSPEKDSARLAETWTFTAL